MVQADRDLGQTIYDVKFWPYGTNNDEQIFAVTGGTEVRSFSSAKARRRFILTCPDARVSTNTK